MNRRRVPYSTMRVAWAGARGRGSRRHLTLFSDGCGGMSICDRRAYGRGENSRRLEPPTQAQQHFSRAILRSPGPGAVTQQCILREGAQIMASLDWSQCPAVESIPGKRSGAWVFRDTRTPVSVVFDNLEAGATIGEVMDWFSRHAGTGGSGAGIRGAES